MNKAQTYLLATRPQFFTAVIAPVLVGTSYAKLANNMLDLKLFLLTILASVLFHGAMNVFNDYFDFKNETDNINKSMLTPFTGGSRMIQNELLTPTNTLYYGLVLLTLGCTIGIYLAILSGPALYIIGITGLLTGFFYTAPPFALASRGLGEVTVALNFGFLSVLGSYYVQTSLLSTDLLILAIAPAMVITAVLYINQFPDFDADKQVGKNNLVVRLGKERARKGLIFLYVITYGAIILTPFIIFAIDFTIYISLLTLPLAVMAVKGLYKNYDSGEELIPAIEKVIQSHFLTGLLIALALTIQYFRL